MIQNALYALLTNKSNEQFREMLRAAPMPLIPQTALFIADSTEEITPIEDAVYTAVPDEFRIIRHPFTGNPALVLVLIPGAELLARRDEIGVQVMKNLPVFLPMSDRVDMALPRMYKTWLASIENSVKRDKPVYEFHAEFVVSHTVWSL